MPKFIILELGVHLLDTGRYLFGEARSVYARTAKISPYPAGEDFAQIVADFSDVTCLIDTSWASFSLEREEVIVHADAVVEGTGGTAVLTPGGEDTLKTMELVFAAYESAASDSVVKLPPRRSTAQ